ncbi:MAG TPA: toxin-antitoxin system HicB family antitoxin [Desulfomonilaceae bacterium]|nr:toxin-antitoxin system HicB family antitoxin [Desulfomonilaceae bacterium]
MKTFPIKIEDDLHKALRFAAINAGKTLRQFVLDVLTEAVKEKK